MGATPIKPIHPMIVEFENDAEMQRFINYANTKEKRNTDELNRIKDRLKKHRRAIKRK